MVLITMPLIRYTQDCTEAAERWPPDDGRPWSGASRGRPKSIAVFESRFIDRVLGRAWPITPILWVGPVVAYSIVRASRLSARAQLWSVAIFFLGWLAWSFLEYLLHRFVFHMGARTPKERLRAFLLHGYHHEFPDDPMRLVAPPLMSGPIGTVVALVLYFTIGSPYWLAMFSGMATGYLAYDWIHYYTHHFHPRGGVGKWLRSYHMLHHFQDRGSRYGVSSPLWDLVFGTYRPLPRGRSEASDAEPSVKPGAPVSS